MDGDLDFEVNYPYEISEIFEKKRQIRFDEDDFHLPSPETFYTEPKWEISELKILKKELNETKSRLDHMHLTPWHLHTKAMNSALFIIKKLRQECRPEFCSWAWSKFTEIVNSFNIIPKVAMDLYREECLEEIKSVHICEAPGAFISATNHYIKHNMPRVKAGYLIMLYCLNGKIEDA